MVITYKTNAKLEAHELSDLFKASGIKRPVEDLNRVKNMIDNSNLLVTAWDGEKLVGVIFRILQLIKNIRTRVSGMNW